MSTTLHHALRIRIRQTCSLLQTAEFWVGIIALATLVPQDTPPLPPELCLICGERGVADAIANILLFFPLGMTLAQRASRVPRYVIPLVLSFTIELAQHFLPGRNPSLGDVLFNSLGGIAGIALATHQHAWWNRSARVARAWFVLTVLTTASILFLTAFLVAPSPTHDLYFGQFTPVLGRLEIYDGRVLEASIGTESLRDGELFNSAGVRRAIERDEQIRVRGVAGQAPASLAPVVSVADSSRRQMFLLGLDRADVVLHYRSRAVAWYLDQMELRAPGLASELRAGEALALSFRPGQSGAEFQVNDRIRHIAAPNMAMGWRLLAGSHRVPAWLSPVLDGAWLLALFAPIGYWSRGGWAEQGAAALPVLLLGGLPLVFSWLAPTPILSWGVALAGLALGAALMRWLPPPNRTAQALS